MSGGPLGTTASFPWTLRRLRGLLPPRLDLVVALGLAALLEVFGRHSSADWIDAIGALVLADLAHLFLARWSGVRRRALALLARITGLWEGLRTPHGLDLRREPPLPGGVPVRPLAAIITLLALLGSLCLGASHTPTEVRAGLQQVSGLATLAVVGALWAALGALGVSVWSTLFASLRRAFSPARAQVAGMLVLGLVALVAWRAPVALGLGVLGAGWLGCTASIAWLTRDVRLAWRDRDGTIRGGCLGAWEALLLTALVALALVPVLLATGDRLMGSASDSTAGTALLGRFVLWSVALWTLVFGGLRIVPLGTARRADPRVARAPRVALTGTVATEPIRARLVAAGFDCVEHGDGDVVVPLEVVAGPAGAFHGPGWTGRATAADVECTGFLGRLARRHRVQARRALRKGLVRALARLRAAPEASGTGTWVAPHLWIATHPSRDGDEEGVLPHGPSWRQLLPQAARAALAGTLGALDVDLLFVEDGVRPRAFARVLDLCFEHHDLFGQRRCEDARHFSGLPGVRVVLHEVGLETPLGPARDRPGPDTRDLGRARILHVFRDRGGESERVRAPAGSDRQPQLVPSW